MRSLPWFALPLVLLACRSVPPEAGLTEAAGFVRERTGHELAWHRGPEAEVERERRVAELLRGELTLARAEALALLAQPRLQESLAELGLAQAELLAASRPEDPRLELEVLGSSQGHALDLGFETPLLSLLTLPLRRRVAERALDATALRSAAAALALLGEVRAAYRRVQASEELVVLAREARDSAGLALELAQRLHAAGNTTALALELERARATEADLGLEQAELALGEARTELALRLGLASRVDELRVAPGLPETSVEEPAPASESDGLELLATRAELESLGVALELAGRTAFVSGLDLGVAFEREAGGERAIGPALALSLPLFTLGEPALRRAEAALLGLAARHRAEVDERRSALSSARARARSAHARARLVADELLPLRRSTLEHLQREYNAMQVDVFRLLEARAAVLAAEAEGVRARLEHWLAREELELLAAGAPPRGARPTELAGSSRSPSAPSAAH